MFNDGGFNSARADAQQKVYDAWTDSLPPDAKLVVVEVTRNSQGRPSFRKLAQNFA